MNYTQVTRWVMQRWFSLSLYAQLMLGSGVLLIAIGSAAAFWNIAQQEKSIIALSEQQILSLAKVMANASSTALETNDFLAWQSMIELSFDEPMIRGVTIIDHNNQLIASATNQSLAAPQNWLTSLLHKVHVLESMNQKERVRVPITTTVNYEQGWLIVEVDYAVLQPALIQLFIDNSIQAWFSIFAQFLMIFFLLFLPVLNFNRAVKFSQCIHDGKGETISPNGGAKETSELIASLNTTSLLFSKQKNEILLINQGLEETVQKRTHDLIVLKQQTDNLIEYAPDAMIVSDEAGDIIRVNYETERLFGYRREELLGNSILMLLHNEVDNDFIAQLHHVFNMTIAERMTHNEIHEYAGVTKFDDFVPIAVNFNAITHDHNQAIIVCAIRDITAEKLAQQALREALTQAQAADRVKTQFLTTMSHEMRTPMNGVLGMAELLSQTGMSEQQKQYLNTILDTGGSLLTIINDILDFSQLESGNANTKINTINLAELLKMVISLVEPSAKQKSLTLNYHVDENCAPFIEVDAGRIRQVLLHYVGNAVKFTEVGSITLSVAKITIKDADVLRFTVDDTGIGIAQSDLQSIFKSFTQADATTTRKHDGAGMGLAICQQIARLLSGSVGVVSTVGEGSHFWLDVPYIESTKDQIEHVFPVSVKSKEILSISAHVLLVEDNPINQKVAMAMLKKAGLTVDIANDGAEGVKKYQSNHYDLIFMDCLMPNMDGFEATRKIRELELVSGKHTPISALTANALEDDRKRCKDAGMDEFVSKPINLGILNEVIKKYLVA